MQIKYTKRDFRNIKGEDVTPFCYGCYYFYKKSCLLGKDATNRKECMQKLFK